MARPKIEIDKKQFESLCGLMCTKEDIAGFFHCCDDTIENFCRREYKKGFSDVYKKYSAAGKISIRRNQMALSKTNASMAIWLGKQYLGQKDNTMGFEHEFDENKENGVDRLIADLQNRKIAGVENEVSNGDTVSN